MLKISVFSINSIVAVFQSIPIFLQYLYNYIDLYNLNEN